MSISKSIKNQNAKEWLTQFPQLRAFSGNRVFKVVGPFIGGIELRDLRGTGKYRPQFVIYPLWKENLNASLEIPIIYNEIIGNKGMPLTIPYENSKSIISTIADLPNSGVLFPLSGDISLDQVFTAVDLYYAQPVVKAQSAHMRAMLLGALLFSSIYVNSNDKIEQVLTLIQKESQSWNMQDFTRWYGDLNEWVDNLKAHIGRRDEFISKVNENKRNNKISELFFSELVCG